MDWGTHRPNDTCLVVECSDAERKISERTGFYTSKPTLFLTNHSPASTLESKPIREQVRTQNWYINPLIPLSLENETTFAGNSDVRV
jgi:ribosome-binding ATPase YchF (GTP1/OBG family)